MQDDEEEQVGREDPPVMAPWWKWPANERKVRQIRRAPWLSFLFGVLAWVLHLGIPKDFGNQCPAVPGRYCPDPDLHTVVSFLQEGVNLFDAWLSAAFSAAAFWIALEAGVLSSPMPHQQWRRGDMPNDEIPLLVGRVGMALGVAWWLWLFFSDTGNYLDSRGL